MKVSEARLGNLVLSQYGHGYEDVVTIEEDFIEMFKSDHVTIGGIPLTEEWLKRCDFSFNQKFEDLSVAYGITKQTFHFVIGNYYKQIHYLHELQNLYFALTGEELTIK